MTPDKLKRVPDVVTVRVGGSLAIPAVLGSLGFDPVEVLAQAGVELKLFDDPDNLMSYALRSRLIELCVERTGCRHFGLLVGAQNGLHSLGLVGLFMKYSPDVGTALRSLVQHLHLHGRGGVVTLTTSGGAATLGYGIQLQQTVATDQIGDGSVAFMLNIMRSLCGADWAPCEALFAHRRPEDVGPFRRLFRSPLGFDATQNALVFSTDELLRRLPTDDPALHRVLQQQIDAGAAQPGEDLVWQVRSVLRNGLRKGNVRADQVAMLFAMHSRTLNRHLQAAGTNFHTLLEEERAEIARQMLTDSRLDVRQIAIALDYADASAFTRAFRRWSGTTPARWRAERRQIR